MSVHNHFDIDAMLESMGAIEFGVVHWFNHDPFAALAGR